MVRSASMVFLMFLASGVIISGVRKMITVRILRWDLNPISLCVDQRRFSSAWVVSQKAMGLCLPVVTADSLDRPVSSISLRGMLDHERMICTFFICLPWEQNLGWFGDDLSPCPGFHHGAPGAAFWRKKPAETPRPDGWNLGKKQS